jgi:hypothetical protein
LCFRLILTGEIVKNHTLKLAVAAVALSAAAIPLAAQSRSTVDVNTLDAAVTIRSDRNRATVTAALTSPRALAAAGSMGLSADGVATRIASLDEIGMKQVADEVLAGGDSTIVLSTTAVIIALLLIILLTR